MCLRCVPLERAGLLWGEACGLSGQRFSVGWSSPQGVGGRACGLEFRYSPGRPSFVPAPFRAESQTSRDPHAQFRPPALVCSLGFRGLTLAKGSWLSLRLHGPWALSRPAPPRRASVHGGDWAPKWELANAFQEDSGSSASKLPEDLCQCPRRVHHTGEEGAFTGMYPSHCRATGTEDLQGTAPRVP